MTKVIFDMSMSLDGFVEGLERYPGAAAGRRRRTTPRVGLRRGRARP